VATYSLTTSPTTIDDGSSSSVLVTNTGAVDVTLSRGPRLRPQQNATVYPEGTALTAATTSGTGSVATTATAAAAATVTGKTPAQVAADIAFTGTYGPTAAPMLAAFALTGRRDAMLSPMVIAGDSISSTAYAGMALGAALGGWPLGQNLDATTPWNTGVAGNTSTQLLARFDTDVIAKAPKVVHILIGTNDAGNSFTIATSAANIRAMVAKCRAVGARVILGTIPPTASTSPTDRKARVIALNQWICRYAIQQRLELADYYRALVDPATGAYLSGYDSGDGVHPTAAGIGVMGAELAASLSRIPSASVLLSKDANDPWNFCVNGLWLSSWATGWTASGSPTGVTVSTTSGDANIQGNWGKIAAVSSSGVATYFQNRSTTQGGTAFVVGNWHMLGTRVQSTALSSSQYWTATDKFINLQTFYLGNTQNKWCATQPGGAVLVNEQPATAASTGNQIQVQLFTGTGDVSYAQHTVYDLTAMGVTDASGTLV
jgi:lysophospholipase L1-like esterase